MSDATHGDNRRTVALAGDALTAVGDVRRLSEHFAWYADQVASEDAKGCKNGLAVLESALRSMNALADEAERPLEEVYDRACREEMDHGSHQEPVRSCPHCAEGARPV